MKQQNKVYITTIFEFFIFFLTYINVDVLSNSHHYFNLAPITLALSKLIRHCNKHLMHMNTRTQFEQARSRQYHYRPYSDLGQVFKFFIIHAFKEVCHKNCQEWKCQKYQFLMSPKNWLNVMEMHVIVCKGRLEVVVVV